MIQHLASYPYAGHSFIQWVMSFMIQIQQLFIHFQNHHRGRLPYTPKMWRAHVRELHTLLNWFIAHPLTPKCICK